jgi:hypothetical protein
MFKFCLQIFTSVQFGFLVSRGRFSIVLSATQVGPWPGFLWDSQPVSTNRLYDANTVILYGFFNTWYWIFSERKWATTIRVTTNTTVRAPHRYAAAWWLAGFISSSARVECHLTVRMNTWLGATFEKYLTKLLLLFQKLWQQIFV